VSELAANAGLAFLDHSIGENVKLGNLLTYGVTALTCLAATADSSTLVISLGSTAEVTLPVGAALVPACNIGITASWKAFTTSEVKAALKTIVDAANPDAATKARLYAAIDLGAVFVSVGDTLNSISGNPLTWADKVSLYAQAVQGQAATAVIINPSDGSNSLYVKVSAGSNAANGIANTVAILKAFSSQ
jgi:hypothetical protein